MERTLRTLKKRLDKEASIAGLMKSAKRKKGEKLDSINILIEKTKANLEKFGGSLNQEEREIHTHLCSLPLNDFEDYKNLKPF